MSKSLDNPVCKLCGHAHRGIAHIWSGKPPAAAPAPKPAPVKPLKGGSRAKPASAKPQRAKAVAKKPSAPKATVIADLKQQVEKAALPPVMVSTRDREKYNAYHRDRRAAKKLGLTVEEYRSRQVQEP